jgi:hypothetical protein
MNRGRSQPAHRRELRLRVRGTGNHHVALRVRVEAGVAVDPLIAWPTPMSARSFRRGWLEVCVRCWALRGVELASAFVGALATRPAAVNARSTRSVRMLEHLVTMSAFDVVDIRIDHVVKYDERV